MTAGMSMVRVFGLTASLLLWISLLAPISLHAVENRFPPTKKQPEIQQIKPKKPVKVKLKRSSEGKYTWELSGDDVDDIVKIDKRLRKLLIVE